MILLVELLVEILKTLVDLVSESGGFPAERLTGVERLVAGSGGDYFDGRGIEGREEIGEELLSGETDPTVIAVRYYEDRAKLGG